MTSAGGCGNVAKEVLERVSEISERLKTTIMIVEHNIKGVLDIVDRAYVLDKGRVVFTGTPTPSAKPTSSPKSSSANPAAS